MTAHLALPYNWINCVDLETCQEYVHLEGEAENLNNYPVEWIEAILNCRISTEKIIFINNEGNIHKNDSPALTWSDGTQEWWINSKLHRENGPAIEHYNGHQEWWQNDLLHRENGPAIICTNGRKEWWLNGEHFPNPPYL